VTASRRGRTRESATNGGGVEVVDDGGEVDDDKLEEQDVHGLLLDGDEAAARSEAGIKVAACSEVGDEVAACSGSGIEDGWQRRH
jgi:hypothetical protein